MATTVTAKGQVTIPKPARDLLGIVPGDKVDFRRAADGSVVLVRTDKARPASRFAKLRDHAGKGAQDRCDHGADAWRRFWLYGETIVVHIMSLKGHLRRPICAVRRMSPPIRPTRSPLEVLNLHTWPGLTARPFSF
jgi:AbrB family looped-hinge helix DNA binding protein